MYTVVEKLILSAFDLCDGVTTSFSAENLVVAAWKKYPDTFGLKGLRDTKGDLKYPDSNRVFAEIMGSKPIRKNGFLIKVGKKKYQLTDSGIEKAKFLLNIDDPSQPEVKKASLDRIIESRMLSLLDSRVITKIKSNKMNDITFFDACNYWGITPKSSSIELLGKLAGLNSLLDKIRKATDNKTFSVIHRGKVFTPKDLDILEQANQLLLTKFDPELKIIKKRTAER